MGKKAWKTRVQSCKANNRAPPSVLSTGLYYRLYTSLFLPSSSCSNLFILSLVAPALRKRSKKERSKIRQISTGGKLEEFGVIPISNRWIVASFSRLNDTRFGGIETGLYLESGCKFWNLGMV